jgi:transcriptional regulator with XRE-family HTH domain
MAEKSFLSPHQVMGRLLAQRRLSIQMSQATLAVRLGVGQSTVSKVERGVQRLDVLELRRWLDAIGGATLTDFVALVEECLATQQSAWHAWSKARPGRSSSGAQKARRKLQPK